MPRSTPRELKLDVEGPSLAFDWLVRAQSARCDYEALMKEWLARPRAPAMVIPRDTQLRQSAGEQCEANR